MATVVTTSNLASNSNSNMKVLQSPLGGNSMCHRCSIATPPDNCIGCHNGAFFHRTCLTCRVCDIKLTLVSYHVNKARPSDLEIYCSKHVPSSQWYDVDAADAAAAMHPGPAQPAAGSWSELERESQVAVCQSQGSNNEHRPAPPPRKHKPAAARPGTVPPQPPTTLSTAPTIAPNVGEDHNPPPPVPKRPPPPAQKPAVPREDASINNRATANVVDTSDINKKSLSVIVDSTTETKPPNRPTLNLNEVPVPKPRRTVFLDKELLEDIAVAQTISETHQQEIPAEHDPRQQVIGYEHDARDEDIKPEVAQPMVRRQGGVRQQQRATAASLAQEALQSRNQRHVTYRQPSEETDESIKSPTSPSKPLLERQTTETKPAVAAKHKHPSTQERELNTCHTGANKEAITPQSQYLLVQPSKQPEKPLQPPPDDGNPLKPMDLLPVNVVNVDNTHNLQSTSNAPCKVPPATAPKPAIKSSAATSQPPQLPPKRPPPRPAPPGKSQDTEALLTTAAEKEPTRTVSPQPPARPQPPKKTADKKPTTKWHQDIDQLVIEEQSIRNQSSMSAEKDEEVSTKIPHKRTSANRSSSLRDVTSSSMSMTSSAAQPPPVPAPRRGSKPEQHILKDMGGVSFESQPQNPASPRSDEAAAAAKTQLLRRPFKQKAAEPTPTQHLSSAATPQLPQYQTTHTPPPSTPPKPDTPANRKSELPDLWVWPQFNSRTSVRASGIDTGAQESSNNETNSLEGPGMKKSKRLSRSKSVKAGSVYDKSKRASVRPTTPPPEVAKPPRNWDSIMEATVTATRLKILDIQRSAEMANRKEEDEQLEHFKMEQEKEKRVLAEKVKVEYKRRLDALKSRFDKDDPRLAEETAKLQAEIKRSHTEQNRAMVQRLQAREQERTGDMVRHQMDNMMATLASERDNIRQCVCDEIRENMQSEGKVMTPEVMSAVMTEADRIIASMMGPSDQHITHRPRVRKQQLTSNSDFQAIDDAVIALAESEPQMDAVNQVNAINNAAIKARALTPSV